jgi:4-aminobutyrate aminotransferase-like enzyme
MSAIKHLDRNVPSLDEEEVRIAAQRQFGLDGEEGRFSHILKLRPPLVFEKKHVDQLVEGLDVCLSQVSVA